MISALLVALLAAEQAPSPPSTSHSELAKQVRELAQQLVSTDEAARQRSAGQLLALGLPAIEPLLEAAKRADPQLLNAIRIVLPRYGPGAIDSLYQSYAKTSIQREFAREEAQKAIAAMGVPVIPELRTILDGPEPWSLSRKPFALGVLRELGPLATNELVDLLDHRESHVREYAANILALVADPKGADAMLARLENKDPALRVGAARGLGNIRERRAVDPLLPLLRDPQWQVREAAAGALVRMYERRFLRPLVRLARSDPQMLVRDTTTSLLLKVKQDPVAVRLGRRYRPLNISPAAEELLQLRWGLYLTGTGLLLWLAVWLAAWRSETTVSIGGFTVSKWSALLASAVLGLYWGYWVRGVSATIENLVLFIAVPVAGFMAVVAGSQLKPMIKPALGALLALGLALVAPSVGMLFYLLLIKLAPWVLGLVVIVAVAAAAWKFWRQPDQARAKQQLRPALVALSTFYVAYGVGWLALWGYLGF